MLLPSHFGSDEQTDFWSADIIVVFETPVHQCVGNLPILQCPHELQSSLNRPLTLPLRRRLVNQHLECLLSLLWIVILHVSIATALCTSSKYTALLSTDISTHICTDRVSHAHANIFANYTNADISSIMCAQLCLTATVTAVSGQFFFLQTNYLLVPCLGLG